MPSRLPRLGRSSGHGLINATATTSFWGSSCLCLLRAHHQGFESIDFAGSTPLRSSHDVPRFCCSPFRVNVFHAEHAGAVSTPTGTAHNQFAVGRPSEAPFVVRVLLLQLHRQTSCHSTSQPVFRDVVHVGVCRLAGDHGGHLAWLAPDLSSAQTPRATSNAFHKSSARTSDSSTSPPPEDTSSPAERVLHQLAHCEIRSCERSWITLTMSLGLSRSDVCDFFTDFSCIYP